MIKFCKNCNDNKINELMCLDGYFDCLRDDIHLCPNCGEELREINFPAEDAITLSIISRSSSLLEEMIELYEKDIIEYELKMSQFRNQAEQKSIIENNKPDNTPKCPKCGSTNIQIVPRKWSLLGGFATKKTDRVCVNCKYKW